MKIFRAVASFQSHLFRKLKFSSFNIKKNVSFFCLLFNFPKTLFVLFQHNAKAVPNPRIVGKFLKQF